MAGTTLLSLPIAWAEGHTTNFLDALFTATSAVCVTGLVVVDTGTHFSLFGQSVILALIQVGGLGFMTFATLGLILLGRRIGFRERLLLREALNKVAVEGVVRLVRYIAIVTAAVEGVGTLILSVRWLPLFGWPTGLYYSLFHSISAFNNAGFDIMGQQFGPFEGFRPFAGDVIINLTISSLFIIGGLGFSVLADLFSYRHDRRLDLHSRITLKTTLLLLAVGTGVILFTEANNPATLQSLPWPSKLLAAYFQAVTPRTAGFSTLDIGSMLQATLLIIIALMFIGASPGSTGGGIKTTTFATLVATFWAAVKGREDVTMGDRKLARGLTSRAFVIAFVSLFLVFTATFILNLTEQAEFLDVLFEATSAFGTVGLSTGLTTQLSTAGRIIIIITMFAGRVGPLTLALALAAKRYHQAYNVPEDRVLIG